MVKNDDYIIFNDFIESYLPHEFLNINLHAPLIVEMEKRLAVNNQFFYVGDLIRLQINFISNGVKDILGVNSEEFNLSTFLGIVHPDDKIRYGHTRLQLIRQGQNLFLDQNGITVLSSNFRLKNGSGDYHNFLFQGYSFHSNIPSNTVYTILLVTDLSGFCIRKHGFHYYIGDDPAYFRYPDKTLLNTGYAFSSREFEILQLIAKGFDSDKISQKLFISLNTVNTHRRNILKKTNHLSTQDLVIDLQGKGIL